MELTGKGVLVTGGANGIGRALVERLVSEGAKTGVIDIDKKGLESLRNDHGESIWCAGCDITDTGAVKKAVQDFCEKAGAVDALVNNAAMIYSAPLVSLVPGAVKMHDAGLWDKVVATDLNSVFYVTSAVVEKMILSRTKGVIVSIGSVAGQGNPGQGAYSACKAAVSALTSVWAKELGPFGIRAACIAPGFTKTDTTLNAMQENVLNEWIRKTPSRRLGAVEEIVDAIIFAIRNDFVNGKTLQIDGGLTL